MSQSVLKDLDQHAFGKTEAEKKNYLAALILKHSHRLQIINEAYEALCTDLVARIEDENYRGLISTTNKYKAMITDGMKNVKDECEIMLKLTGKKTAIIFTDKLLTKEQNQMKKLEATNARRLGQKNKARSAPLTELSNMNKKFKLTVTPDEKKQSNQSCNPSRRTRKIDREIPSCRDDNDYPFVEEGKDSNTFHLSKKKSVVLPKPSANTEVSKKFPNLYSLRETVLHLHPYYGKGARNIFKFMLKENYVSFSTRVYEHRSAIYRNDNVLPEPDVMTVPMGRSNNGINKKKIISLNDNVQKKGNEGENAMIDAQGMIMDRRMAIKGNRAAYVHRTTVRNYAQAAIMLDARVDAVDEASLRLQSESRQVASHSLRTCLSQIVATVRTQFIPGKWHERPNDLSLQD